MARYWLEHDYIIVTFADSSRTEAAKKFLESILNSDKVYADEDIKEHYQKYRELIKSLTTDLELKDALLKVVDDEKEIFERPAFVWDDSLGSTERS